MTQFKILAYIIAILIAITAILSVSFVVYPLFTANDAPQILLDILIVMNVTIPVLGIATMIAFIHYKNKDFN
jgi:hypothetical protein